MDFSRRFCPGDDPDDDLDANFVDTRLAAALLLDGDGSTSAKRDGVEAAVLARFVAPRTRGRGVIVDVAGGLVVTGAPVDVGALLDAGASARSAPDAAHGAAVETFIAPNAFNALKAALLTYAKQLSQAWGPKGIRVNTVTPGPVTFPGGNWTKIKDAYPDLYEATEKAHVFGRLGSPEEVANTVVFLASPAASFTTGTNVVIDGGYTKRVQF